MLSATCHCGAITVHVSRRPTEVTHCNCSLCRRYGTRWTYYEAAEVSVTAAPDAIVHYAWANKRLRFARCSTCGCVTHWENVTTTNPKAEMGVNARNFDPEALGDVTLRLFDGAGTGRFLE